MAIAQLELEPVVDLGQVSVEWGEDLFAMAKAHYDFSSNGFSKPPFPYIDETEKFIEIFSGLRFCKPHLVSEPAEHVPIKRHQDFTEYPIFVVSHR